MEYEVKNITHVFMQNILIWFEIISSFKFCVFINTMLFKGVIIYFLQNNCL